MVRWSGGDGDDAGGVGISGVGGQGRGTVSKQLPSPPNTEAPRAGQQKSMKRQMKQQVWLVGWCPAAGWRGLDGLSSFHWPPSMGWTRAPVRVPEYELEREKEKTLRQH